MRSKTSKTVRIISHECTNFLRIPFLFIRVFIAKKRDKFITEQE
jgi:hypothetical protein